VSLTAVGAVTALCKEMTLVAFDSAFAAAAGWPVAAIDAVLAALVAAMVVTGLPGVGAVLVTALVVIPPVAARLWTERVGSMLLLAGGIGLAAALIGTVASAAWPGLATGPLVVLAAAAIFAVSLAFGPHRRRRRA
jgi:manganese/zinc/iron transport system permease protein